jgi:HSP20 family molecular chaperone IbpA
MKMCEDPRFKAKYAHCGPQMHFGDIRGMIGGVMHHMKNCCEKLEHWIPHTLDEYEDYFLIKIPMPGYTKEDIDISLISDNINIKAKKSQAFKEKEKPIKKGSVKRGPEFFLMGDIWKVWDRDFDLDIPLSPNANHEDIRPKISNGLLRIKLGKKAPKNININEEV